MGFPLLMMLFIAAVIIAVGLNHLFLAFRIKRSRIHFFVFVTGAIGFAWFVTVFIAYRATPEINILERIYRYHLIAMQLALLFLVLSYSILVGYGRKKWQIAILLVFGSLMIVTALLPDKMIFTSGPSASVVILFGSAVTMMAEGVTYWRLLCDLSIILALLILVSIGISQLSNGNGRLKVNLVIVASILFTTAVIDHLTDSGTIAMFYLVPVGYFVSFGMLSAATLGAMVEDIQKNIIIALEERKWKLLVNEVKLIVVELNTLGQVKYANPYLFELTGYSEEEVLGKDWFEILLPSSYSYEVQSAFLEILSNDFHPVYLNPILTKREEVITISWYNVRLRDKKGKITGSISIGVDISEFQDEKEKMEKSLLEARETIEKLQKKLR